MTEQIKVDNTLHEWSHRMLRVVHRVCGNDIEGGIGGLGSQDGIWVDAGEAMKLLLEFERVGYEVGPLSTGDYPLIARDHQCSTRGLLVLFDEDFEGERNLQWYDEDEFFGTAG